MSQLELGGAARRVLDVAGGRLAVLQAGPADGPPALLVPGYTGSKEDFGPVLAALGAAGFAVTALDLPGQFESPGLGDPAAYRPALLAGHVVALAAQLGPRVHLLGHSFGGLVARAAVLADPARFASLVLLCSGPAGIDGGRRERVERLRPLLAEAGLPGVLAAMNAADAADAAFVAPPAALVAFLERRFLAGDPHMLEGMGEALLDEPDRVAELLATQVPVLVAHGVDDDAWPPAVQHDMARRLGAAYVVLADSAHSPAVENPPATAGALIDFWRQPRTGSPAEGSASNAS